MAEAAVQLNRWFRPHVLSSDSLVSKGSDTQMQERIFKVLAAFHKLELLLKAETSSLPSFQNAHSIVAALSTAEEKAPDSPKEIDHIREMIPPFCPALYYRAISFRRHLGLSSYRQWIKSLQCSIRTKENNSQTDCLTTCKIWTKLCKTLLWWG